MSLAIGNKGQNVRLAAKLTGWKIDIRPESGFYGEDEEDKPEEPTAASESSDEEALPAADETTAIADTPVEAVVQEQSTEPVGADEEL